MAARVELNGIVCIYGALICLVLPFSWVLSILIAAVIHELCHILAVWLTGGKIYCITINSGGAVIDASSMTDFRQLICILAGPAGSLLMLMTAGIFSQLAFCGFIQGIFNLLPLYPLDGGRALLCIMKHIFSRETAEKICKRTEAVVLLVLAGIVVYIVVRYHMGFSPAFLLLLLLRRIISGKTPCKDRNNRVQ